MKITNDEIDKLESGEKIDELVARLVFRREYDGREWSPSQMELDALDVLDAMPGPGVAIFKMAEGWMVRGRVCGNWDLHMVTDDCCVTANAPTLPLAICRAALKARRS